MNCPHAISIDAGPPCGACMRGEPPEGGWWGVWKGGSDPGWVCLEIGDPKSEAPYRSTKRRAELVLSRMSRLFPSLPYLVIPYKAGRR